MPLNAPHYFIVICHLKYINNFYYQQLFSDFMQLSRNWLRLFLPSLVIQFIQKFYNKGVKVMLYKHYFFRFLNFCVLQLQAFQLYMNTEFRLRFLRCFFLCTIN